jgi:hypothetical protein
VGGTGLPKPGLHSMLQPEGSKARFMGGGGKAPVPCDPSTCFASHTPPQPCGGHCALISCTHGEQGAEAWGDGEQVSGIVAG